MTANNATATQLKIEGFADYFLAGDTIIRVSTGKEIEPKFKNRNNEPFYRLYDNQHSRKQLTIEKIRSLAGLKLKLPSDAKEIRGSEGKYFIDRKGTVYSFAIKNPEGVSLNPLVLRGKYPEVKVKYCDVRRMVGVHVLLCDTFLMSGYAAKGLVCMHADNNKHNYSLDNLSIGTHQQNLQDAHTDGLHPNRSLPRNHPDQPKAYRDSLKRPDMTYTK